MDVAIAKDFLVRKRTDVEPFERAMIAQAGSTNPLKVFNLRFGEWPRLGGKLPNLVREQRLIEELLSQGGLTGHGDGADA
jgi:hypothetical protein